MADPRTIIVPLTSPGQTATYRLAPGVTQYIQSVVATVDTSASSDVTPVLTISEQSGVVVGDKQQTNAIAGGGSGRATWALGLADESAGGTAQGFIRYVFNNLGAWLRVLASGNDPTPFAVGGESGNWSVGISGPDTAFGGDNQVWLVSPNLVQLSSPGGSILNDAGAAGDWEVNTGTAQITAQGSITFVEHGNGINFTSTNPVTGEFFVVAPFFHFQTTHADFRLLDDGDVTWSGDGGASISFDDWSHRCNSYEFQLLTAGNSLTVQDHSGQPIFRIDENGDLHGKTGKTLTFDL